MKKFFLFVITVMSVSGSLFAQGSKSDLEKQRAAIQREIDEVRRSLNETKKNKKESYG